MSYDRKLHIIIELTVLETGNIIAITVRSFNGQLSHHLKQLIIDNFSSTFEVLEIFAKQTPNFRSLTTSTFDEDKIDGYRWEQFTLLN